MDDKQRAAIERMALRRPEEAMMAHEGQTNAGGEMRVVGTGGDRRVYYDPAPLSEYPKMLYRKTDREQVQEWADTIGTLRDAPMVINRFDGLLCETTVVNSADEAEIMASQGWDVSPKAAYGEVEGLAKATTAKDEEIAELKRQLAAKSEVETVKRGPGRPPKPPVDASAAIDL